MNVSIDYFMGHLNKLTDYLEAHNYKGLEPYDVSGLKYLNFMRRSRVSHVLLTQLMRLCPSEAVWLWLGAKEREISKAMILFARGYLRLYEAFRDRKYLEKASWFLSWLEQNCSPEYDSFCVGGNFDLQMKSYHAGKHSPSPMLTAYAVDTFLDAFELTSESGLLDTAARGVDFLLDDLPIGYVDERNIYFSYVPNGLIFVPNVPAIVAGTLAHYYKFTVDERALSHAVKALRYVVKAQLPDGSWLYAPGSNYVDSFHTGFVLESLYKFQKYTGRNDFEAAFRKGLEFYENTFFSKEGVPRHKIILGVPKNADSLLTKIDIRDCAQGIILFSQLSGLSSSYLDSARQLASWTIKDFRDSKGHFYYQKTLFHSIKVPFIRSQAWMLCALSELISSIEGSHIQEESGAYAKQ